MNKRQIPVAEMQKKMEPVRPPEQKPVRQQEQGQVQTVAPQVAYRRAQVSCNELRPADILILQRTVGNLRAQQVMNMINRRQQPSGATGHVLIGAAAQTPVKSVGEYSDLIIKMLAEDKGRKLSIQDAVRKAAESKSIGLAAPTTAETGKAKPPSKTGRRIALLLTNAKYQKPSEDLSKTDGDGRNMRTQLQARHYKTEWLKNQTAAKMIDAFSGFLTDAQPSDDVVIFYSGHGEVEGMQGVDNQFVSPQIVAGWKDQALAKGYALTVIIEACHAGSTTDFIRTQESVRIRQAGQASGKNKAAKLAEVAKELQQIKDGLAKLERAKQALMEEPLFSRLQKDGTLDQESKIKDKEIDAAWQEALPKISGLAKQVTTATHEQLAIPTFGRVREWLNTQQLDQLDTMTNRTLELAREALSQ